jgi:type IV pilus assembly protein PilY1
MNATTKRFAWLGLGTLWALVALGPALADDTELFIGTNQNSQARPNILFVFDNSVSMGTDVVTQDTYDPTMTYPSIGCDANRVYWRSGAGTPPDCSTTRWFNMSALKCKAAVQAFGSAGSFTGKLGQYDPTSSVKAWVALATGQTSRAVECEADAGIDGDGVNAANLYARNGLANVNGYWGTSANKVSWSGALGTTYQLFSGNYLNWSYGPTRLRPRIDVVKDVATNLLDSINGVNVGLMTFNDIVNTTVGSQGGYVAYPLTNIATGRQAMKDAIATLTPSTYTPLSETLYEASQYYMGRNVDYGAPKSVAGSRDPNNTNQYLTPIGYDCQKNYIVYLTDGEPTKDVDADTKIKALQDRTGRTFGQLVGGACDVETYPVGFNPSGGDCLDELAEFMNKGDLSSLPGQQNVSTYTIGFTVDLPILSDTAQRGGGAYYTADDTASLAGALTNIVTSILSTDTTFTSPTVAVNSFNRTQNLSDLFISMFRPTGRAHWPGNLKKYRLRTDSVIADATGTPAVDPATGFFADTARSIWSPTVDGANVQKGGAANLIPAPASRLVYTYLGTANLTAAANRVTKTNNGITDAMLNTGTAGDPTRDQVIDFITGLDLPDTNQNNITNEPRRQMGDPLHSQPVSVIYGPTLQDGVVFFATNDGYLHAVDIQTGIEKWSFVPPEFLGNQMALYKDASTASKLYGIDGDLRVQTIADNNGIIDPGEKVYLYFGMRRGGSFYYALDVSNPNSPSVMFRLTNSQLPGVGQTWATPVPTHMDVAGAAQNANKLVLVIAGGYENDQDNAALTTDTSGNAIYVVDAVTGARLWYGSDAVGATRQFATNGRSMSYSIPAQVRVADFDGDGFADRLYAADMGGQIWRFDVWNGQTAANLITGGVIAQLGGAPNASPSLADTRRFYYAPDVAVVNTRTENFIHIGIGSGYRAHPLSTSNNDRFYALRDYNIGPLTQAQYNALPIITDGSLVPVTAVNTTVPHGGPGWRLDLNLGGTLGEKVLAEARTYNNEVIFSTFMPGTSGNSCQPQLGTNRIYQMSIFNGTPVTNLDGSSDPSTLTMSDLYTQGEGGILPTAQTLFLGPDANHDGIPDSEQDTDGDGIPDSIDTDKNGNGIPDDQEDDDGDGIPNGQDSDANGNGIPDDQEGNQPTECVGLICFPAGYQNVPVRTFWTQRSLD